MKFVEMTGRSLVLIVSDDEISTADLATAGVTDETVVRVNQHGDIEIRRSEGAAVNPLSKLPPRKA